MSGTWQDRIETIAGNLLTLEINTAVKPGMVAQKMPDLPVALHVIIDVYHGFLKGKGPGGGDPLSKDLVAASATQIAGGDMDVRTLEAWFDHDRAGEAADEVTNGAETFEALRWAAHGVLKASRQSGAAGSEAGRTQMLLQRIQSNSRQLRSAALVLERQYSIAQHAGLFDAGDPGLECDARLRAVAATRGLPGGPNLLAGTGRLRLFGGVVEQTAEALFKDPKPAIRFAPDLAVLVRKAWDVGLEEVMMQTVIQLDGDVLVRATEAVADGQRAFLGELHRQAVREGMSQWKLLFQTAGELIRDTGQLLFGRK